MATMVWGVEGPVGEDMACRGVTLQREADLRGPLGHCTGGKVCVGTLNPEDCGGTSGFIHCVSTIDKVVGTSVLWHSIN